MLLEEIVEIIEQTDTDSFAEALDLYNLEGVISASMLPFLNVVFDKAPEALSLKLQETGFKGKVEITKLERAGEPDSYAIYDSTKYSLSEIKQI